MKAIVAQELGPPESLAVEDVPSRPPAAGEMRVAIHYAGVSFVDVLTAAGGYQVKPEVPFIPGSEFSGVVVETGPDVTDYAVGDEVAGGQFGGVLAEEITLGADTVSRVPPGYDLAQAAVVRSSFLTALYALKLKAQVQPGEVVLVLGAGGAVGIAAVQLARHMGARVIGSASSEEKRQLILDSGAEDAIDSNAADWRDQVKALTGGKGADVVIDPLGGDQTERAFRSIAWNGRHVVIGFAAGEIPRLPTNLALLKGAALMGVDLRQFTIRQPEDSDRLSREVDALMGEGVARPPIAQVFEFEQFQDAMHLAASGKAAGRVLLRMPAAR